MSLLVAIDVNDEGFREVLAVAEGSKEDKASRNIAVGKFAPKTSVKKEELCRFAFRSQRQSVITLRSSDGANRRSEYRMIEK